MFFYQNNKSSKVISTNGVAGRNAYCTTSRAIASLARDSQCVCRYVYATLSRDPAGPRPPPTGSSLPPTDPSAAGEIMGGGHGLRLLGSLSVGGRRKRQGRLLADGVEMV
ncbi:hypothetical protein BS78_01G357100 [Paspalum vaginatum]|nr:hypothetical protein BS78_01G357100 [Paspalum vaginatum]